MRYNFSYMIRLGLIQAAAVSFYCSLVGFLMWNGNKIFGGGPNYFGPVAFLLLFSTSALICGLMVFYQPYQLFFSNKKKEALDLVLYTAVFLFLFFLIFLSLAVFIK